MTSSEDSTWQAARNRQSPEADSLWETHSGRAAGSLGTLWRSHRLHAGWAACHFQLRDSLYQRSESSSCRNENQIQLQVSGRIEEITRSATWCLWRLFQLAACLDPTFKMAWCANLEERESLQHALRDEMDITDGSSTQQPQSSELPPPPKKVKKLFGCMGEPTTVPAANSNDDELTNFLATPHLTEDTDPLQYWRLDTVSSIICARMQISCHPSNLSSSWKNL